MTQFGEERREGMKELEDRMDALEANQEEFSDAVLEVLLGKKHPLSGSRHGGMKDDIKKLQSRQVTRGQVWTLIGTIIMAMAIFGAALVGQQERANALPETAVTTTIGG